MQVWDAHSGTRLTTVVRGDPQEAPVWEIAVSPDNLLLATTSLDSTVHVWQPFRTNGQVFNLAHGDTVEDIAFSPDGSLLATASRDKLARIWDMKTGEQRLMLAHDLGVRAVAFSPDGRRLATAGSPVRIWDASTGAELVTFVPEPHSAGALVYDVA